MKRLNKIIAIAAALSLGVLVTYGNAFADSGQERRTSARHARIVGLWDVDVTVTHCGTGATLSTFSALHKYELGGTGQVVPYSDNSGLSAHMMVWEHVEGNDYMMAVKMYRFDAARNNIGWVILNNEVSINEDADEYHGSGTAQFFDAAGNLLGGSCPTFVGTRFTGEP